MTKLIGNQFRRWWHFVGFDMFTRKKHKLRDIDESFPTVWGLIITVYSWDTPSWDSFVLILQKNEKINISKLNVQKVPCLSHLSYTHEFFNKIIIKLKKYLLFIRVFQKKVKNLGNADFQENPLSDTFFWVLSNVVKIIFVGRLEKTLCSIKLTPHKEPFHAFFRQKIHIKKITTWIDNFFFLKLKNC